MIIPVIFEDTNILIINKPSGMVVHPFDYSTEETLLDFLMTHIPDSFSIDNIVTLQDKRTINLGGIVHKLDRDTSGVMVIAKNKETFDELKAQFRNHTTKKTYIALVDGIVKEDTFTIDAPLGRNKKDYKQQVNPENPRGELRDAVTEVKVVTKNKDKNTTLVELTPKTGRTHQLRAHMSHISHPIVGDKAYGSTQDSPRIMLHAKTLMFDVASETYFFATDVPEEFILNNFTHLKSFLF
jgi:23S rRNA pseudouridine1911/1915/1917 synthase